MILYKTMEELVGSTTKMEAAYLSIRGAIEQGRYGPGERLPLRRLIADLNMSPTPIREALRSLAADGLVVLQPHQGALVAVYGPEKTAEAYLIRLALEPLASELAAKRATDDQLAEIRRLHERLGRAVTKRPGSSQAPRLNAAWHRAIHEAAASPYLVEFIARLWAWIPVEAMWRNRRAEESVADHAEITDALERRDATSARELTHQHISRGAEAALAQTPDGMNGSRPTQPG